MCVGDWSSDVCSSDLSPLGSPTEGPCGCYREVQLVAPGPTGILLGPRNAPLQGTDPESQHRKLFLCHDAMSRVQNLQLENTLHVREKKTTTTMKVSVAQSYLTVCNPMDCSLCPWDSPGKNTGVGAFSSMGIFPTQGSNPGLLHCRQILYCLSHQESPLEN